MIKKIINKQYFAFIAVTTPLILGYIYYFYKKRKSQNELDKDNFDVTNVKNQVNEVSVKKSKTKSDIDLALELKAQGNINFKQGKYKEAIHDYSGAIKLYPKKNEELAYFYNNRAAAYFHERNYQDAIEDCCKALEFKKRYVKPIFRRGLCYEYLDKLHESYVDFTTVCFLEQFADLDTLQLADRVLKKLSKQKAKTYIKDKIPIMPAKMFIKSFFESFKQDPFFLNKIGYWENEITNNAPKQQSTEDSDLYESTETFPDEQPPQNTNTILGDIWNCLNCQDYDGAYDNAHNFIQQECKEKPAFGAFLDVNIPLKDIVCGDKALSKEDLLVLLYLCTCQLLIGSVELSKRNFNILCLLSYYHLPQKPETFVMPMEDEILKFVKNIKLESQAMELLIERNEFIVNVLVKLANCTTQEGEQTKALSLFNAAIAIDPHNCDALYHRGQYYTLFGNYENALTDFESSLQIQEKSITKNITGRGDFDFFIAVPGSDDNIDDTLKIGNENVLTNGNDDSSSPDTEKSHFSKQNNDSFYLLTQIQRDYIKFKMFLAQNMPSAETPFNLGASQQQELSEASFNSLTSPANPLSSLLRGTTPSLTEVEQRKLLKDARTLLEKTLIDTLKRVTLCATTTASHGYGDSSKDGGIYCDKPKFSMALSQTISEGYVFLAQAYSDLLLYNEAEVELKMALKIDPSNFSVYVHLALLALQQLNSAASDGSAGGLVPPPIMGTTLDQEKTVKKAISYIEKCLSLEPKCEFAYETLGTIYMQNGKFADAIINFEKAMTHVKSELELIHLVAMKETVQAQKEALHILEIFY